MKRDPKYLWAPLPCNRCGRKTRTRFVVGDDLENPRPYHKKCHELFMFDVIVMLTMQKEKVVHK